MCVAVDDDGATITEFVSSDVGANKTLGTGVARWNRDFYLERHEPELLPSDRCALLKRPKVLIFDEATSSLDQHAAEAFVQTIDRLKDSVTMLFIAHNLPRGLQVDEVLQFGVRRAKHMSVSGRPQQAEPVE